MQEEEDTVKIAAIVLLCQVCVNLEVTPAQAVSRGPLCVKKLWGFSPQDEVWIPPLRLLLATILMEGYNK